MVLVTGGSVFTSSLIPRRIHKVTEAPGEISPLCFDIKSKALHLFLNGNEFRLSVVTHL